MQLREELESYFAVELGTERDVFGWTEVWKMESGRPQCRCGEIDLFGNSRNGGISLQATLPGPSIRLKGVDVSLLLSLSIKDREAILSSSAFRTRAKSKPFFSETTLPLPICLSL